MYTHPANRYTQFITPLGGIIALAYFFMPWLTNKMAEVNLSLTRSGFQMFMPMSLAPRAIFYFFVFVASIVIVGLSLYMVLRRTPWKSRAFILISSGIGLSILLAEQLRYTRITETVASANYSTEFGFFGAAVGFVVAAIGVLLIRVEEGSGYPKVSVAAKRLWFVVHGGGIITMTSFFSAVVANRRS